MSIFVNEVEIFCDHENCDESILMKFTELEAYADCAVFDTGMTVPDGWYGVVGDSVSMSEGWDIDPISLDTKCPEHIEEEVA